MMRPIILLALAGDCGGCSAATAVNWGKIGFLKGRCFQGVESSQDHEALERFRWQSKKLFPESEGHWYRIY